MTWGQPPLVVHNDMGTGPRWLSTNLHEFVRISFRFAGIQGRHEASRPFEIEGGATRFRDSTGGGASFVSPAGRIRGRRRTGPTFFVVAAAGRSVDLGASREHETARRAVHESPRARDTKSVLY